MLGLGTLVGEGFGLAFVVYAFVWGMSLPIRFFFKFLGF